MKELLQAMTLYYLKTKPSYAYRLRQNIQRDFSVKVSQGDFYRVLQDLEKYGYVVSRWMFHTLPLKSVQFKRTIKKPIRMYSITQSGIQVYKHLKTKYSLIIRRLEN
jgi:DNA-binding PadR family transcriptional regulator